MLKRVLSSNITWPLIVVGVGVRPDVDTVIIPATISERDLHTDMLVVKQNLVIDGLDRISPDQQKKFITLLKDRRTGLRKLPADTRIIIPVRSADKLSSEIKKLALIYNV